MTRAARLRLAGGLVLALVAIGIVFAAFHYTGRQSPTASGNRDSTPTTEADTTTSAAPTTTVTTAPPPAVPPSPQPTAEQAANALISSWASGNQARAQSVATSQAVGTLFAAPYHSGMAIDRGCNNGSPVTCAFGPPGGASPADPLYQLAVLQTPGGGWYVSSVQVLG